VPDPHKLQWADIVDRISPNVFSIRTEKSLGSGFVVSITESSEETHHTLIATAWHVIEDLVGSNGDIELVSSDRKEKFSSVEDNIDFYQLGPELYYTALIHCSTKRRMIKRSDLLPVFPEDFILARGAEIGWLGFPGIVHPELCFFSGHISGYNHDPPAYLVDGVAINGVSGGPVFDENCNLVGMMTAYLPNRVNKSMVLPGLASVTPIGAIRFWLTQWLGARVD
jgi:Trypsin-like peptidase domain